MYQRSTHLRLMHVPPKCSVPDTCDTLLPSHVVHVKLVCKADTCTSTTFYDMNTTKSELNAPKYDMNVF